MLKKVISLFIIIFTFNASANELRLLKSFVLCKSDFFNKLYENRDILEKHTTIKLINSNQAYIPVTNRTDNSKNYRYFDQPMRYKDLTINGYYDSAMDHGKVGRYYFWGFILDNDPEQIKNSFNFLNWKEIEENKVYIANAKIHYISSDLNSWQDNENVEVGVKTIPAPDTTEKLLLIEKTPTMTLLICSVQGVVPPELLAIERPDINRD
ncbi:hypothetical protein PT276_04045 [Orbaceae bacterium ESL0721]|nr:hypothetical protein [Orbaceae bacterium ESL0721]